MIFQVRSYGWLMMPQNYFQFHSNLAEIDWDSADPIIFLIY